MDNKADILVQTTVCYTNADGSGCSGRVCTLANPKAELRQHRRCIHVVRGPGGRLVLIRIAMYVVNHAHTSISSCAACSGAILATNRLAVGKSAERQPVAEESFQQSVSVNCSKLPK